MSDLDYNEPIEILDSVYWVGRREGSALERNIYMRVFKAGGREVNLLIDPGPPSDITVLSQKLTKLIKGVRRVNLIFLNHQDPDVSYNAAYFQKLNPNAYILCSEDTWRLVRFYGLSEKHYRPVERFKKMRIMLNTGHQIQFVPSPYCHFRGAVMLYDVESRILFSGDLFAGLSSESEDLYADESYWENMKIFHQIYMPSQDALRHAINRIRELDPQPIMIAPQHGRIIMGNLVEYFLDKLYNLEVGLDLFIKEREKESYILAMNELIEEIKKSFDDSIANQLLTPLVQDRGFTTYIVMDNQGVKDLKVDPGSAMSWFTEHIVAACPPEMRDVLDLLFVTVLTRWNIDVPSDIINPGSSSEEAVPGPEMFDEF